jgi:hypothetical protein
MSYGRMESIEIIIRVLINLLIYIFFKLKYVCILHKKDALIEIVAKLLALVPPWTRIYRI